MCTHHAVGLDNPTYTAEMSVWDLVIIGIVSWCRWKSNIERPSISLEQNQEYAITGKF